MSRTSRLLPRLLGGAAVAALLVGLTPATAQAANSDAPSSYGSVSATTKSDAWKAGSITKATDVDVYRFKTTTTRYARALLGDLKADYRLALLNSAGKVVTTSDRSGLANEEVYAKLTKGTWYLRVDSPRKKTSTKPYVVKFSSLPEGLILLSKAQYVTVGGLKELDFEVLNNTSKPIAGVTTTVRDKACATSTSCYGEQIAGTQRVIPARGRSSFYTEDIVGISSYAFSVKSMGNVSLVSKISATGTKAVKTKIGVNYALALTNSGTRAACFPTAIRSGYDARGGLRGETEIPWSEQLPAGATWKWPSVSMPPLPPRTVRTEWAAYQIDQHPDGTCEYS